MSIIFLGPPGVGKGTQSDFLAKTLGYIHLTTGNLLRKFSQGSSDLAKSVKDKMLQGALISDDLVLQILIEYLSSLKNKKIIFDGMPRNCEQVSMLSNVTKMYDINITHVINFCIDEEILTKRVLGRFVCDGCMATYNDFFNKTKINGVCDYCGSKLFNRRSDDNDASLKHRIKIFNNNNYFIKKKYSKKGLLFEVSADRRAEDISKDIMKICSI